MARPIFDNPIRFLVQLCYDVAALLFNTISPLDSPVVRFGGLVSVLPVSLLFINQEPYDVGFTARIDLGTGETVSFQIVNPIPCLFHNEIRIPEGYGPSRTGKLTGGFSRLSVPGRLIESIVTEVALSHFGFHRVAVHNIRVPWNCMVFTFCLTWLDLPTETFVRETL